MLRRADAEVARRLAEADRAAEQVTGAGRREADRIVFAARSDAQASLDEAARHRAETDQACAADRRSRWPRSGPPRSTPSRWPSERAEQERTSAWAESERRRAHGGGGLLPRHGPAPRGGAGGDPGRTSADRQWVQRTRAEATRQARAEITAAEETARRMVAEAQARVEELADVRSRIAAQLRGTQSQLSTAIDSLAPEALPPAVPTPAVAAAPPAPVVNAAPVPPAVTATPVPPAVGAAPAAPAVESAPQPPALPAASDAPALPAASADDQVEPVDAARAHRRAGHGRAGHRRPGRSRAVRSHGGRGPTPDAAPTQAPEQRLASLTTTSGATQRRPPGLRCNRCAQHARCQCRRSATDPCSPAGHVTRCPVPAVMSWSQPGQR